MTRPTDCTQHSTMNPPSGYVAGHEWRDKMAKTHECVFCDECQRWAIWRPKGDRLL